VSAFQTLPCLTDVHGETNPHRTAHDPPQSVQSQVVEPTCTHPTPAIVPPPAMFAGCSGRTISHVDECLSHATPSRWDREPPPQRPYLRTNAHAPSDLRDDHCFSVDLARSFALGRRAMSRPSQKRKRANELSSAVLGAGFWTSRAAFVGGVWVRRAAGAAQALRVSAPLGCSPP
jgi:hypothetical protein